MSHIHISREHLDKLFGEGYELTPRNYLTQKGEFASEEIVTLINHTKKLENIRILGPVRDRTQVELSRTNAIRLELNPPIRDSGNHEDTPGITIIGQAGSITIIKGVILAMRHIHMSPKDSDFFHVRDSEIVQFLCGEQRRLIFDSVLVRVNKNYVLDFHIDTDEANAAGINTGDTGYLIKFSRGLSNKKESRRERTLITETDVLAHLNKGEKLIVTKDTIFTPLALDLARKHNLV